MTDLETAVQNLGAHSICLCKDGVWFTDDGRGIAPMLRLIESDRDLTGYAAADVIVGKAAAMLFVKAGVAAVWGKVMSQSAADYLHSRGIPHSWETLTARIINRAGTGVCPMEQTVSELEDAEVGYRALLARVQAMRTASQTTEKETT